MKTKQLISALLAASLVAATAVSVSAATLTNLSPDYNTEVTAAIEKAAPGEVSYTIEIPEKIDFGTLTQDGGVLEKTFDITLTELSGLSESDYSHVAVYVKDSTADDGNFYISQQDAESDPFTLAYNVFASSDDEYALNDDSDDNTGYAIPGAYGYSVVAFSAVEQSQTAKVTLDQSQISDDVLSNAGLTLDDVAGTYSGTIVFHSSLVSYGS